MRYVTLGVGTGLRVSELCLGTVNFGTRWGSGASPDDASRIFSRFVEAGGNFVDTADIYQFGEAEELVGQFIGAERERFVVATKYSFGSTGTPDVLRSGNSRKNLHRSVEASLRRLNTEYLDVLFVHAADELTSSEEIAWGLDELVRSGKVLYVGLSNFAAWKVARVATIAELRGWAKPSAIQIEYSLAERGAERDLLPMSDAMGIGITLWSPLAGGLLTGKYRQSDDGRLSDWNDVIHREDTPQKTALLDSILDIASAHGVEPSQVAMAWLARRASTLSTSFIPVIGPRHERQLESYLAALELQLDGAEVQRLDAVSAPQLGVPHETAAAGVSLARGGDPALVASPRVPVR
jgi:aryl-alcohol dehydrogenase-like predicted oxidoreductase